MDCRVHVRQLMLWLVLCDVFVKNLWPKVCYFFTLRYRHICVRCDYFASSERMFIYRCTSVNKRANVIGWNVLMWLVETYSVKIVSLIRVGNIQELPQFPRYGSMISLNVKKMCCIFSKDSSVRVLPMKKAAAMLSVKASPLLAVPNITAHSSTASIPTSYYSTWHYYCLWALKG